MDDQISYDKFVTDAGIEVSLRPISLERIEKARLGVEKDFKVRGEPIDPPTYEVDMFGGIKETFPHNETTIIIEGNPEETAKNQVLWDKYIAARKKMIKEQSRVSIEICLRHAVIAELPSDNSWEIEQREEYIDVPEDPKKKLYHWLRTEVFLTPYDFQNLIERVTILSAHGVSEEDIQASLNLFRNRLPAKPGSETAPTN